MMHVHTYILFCVLDFPIFPLPFALFSSLSLSVSVSLSHSLSLSLPPSLPPSHSLSVSLFPSLPPSLYLSLLSSSLSLSLPSSFSLSLSFLPFPSLLSFRKQIESINTPSPRCSHQAVFFKDKIYVFGGEYATLDQFHHYRYKNLDVYCLP